MNQSTDHSDAQVKGLDRYIPSTLSRSLLIALLTAPIAIFTGLTGLHEFIFAGMTKEAVGSTALTYSLISALVIAIFLVLNLSVIIYQSKHSRVSHYSNLHPNMTFRWLWENSTTKHYLFMAILFLSGLLIGLYVSP